MVTQRIQGTEEEWETVSGLPNDVDLWITNCRFGSRDEYAAAASVEEPPVLAILTLANEAGEQVAEQGYSVGSGWTPEDDGQTVSHPARTQIVRTSRYGTLIDRVVKKLGVDMKKYGTPRRAATWVGLGFHWNLDKLPVVGGGTSDVLLPTEFLGDQLPFELAEGGAVPLADVPAELTKRLTGMAKSLGAPDFRRAALKVEGTTEYDSLMADIMDQSPNGFWARVRASK